MTRDTHMFCRRCRHHLLETATVCPECGRGYDPTRPRTFFRRRRSVAAIIVASIALMLVVPVALAYAWTIAGIRVHLDGTGDGWALMGPAFASYATIGVGAVQLLLLPFCWRRIPVLLRMLLIASALLGGALLPLLVAADVYWR